MQIPQWSPDGAYLAYVYATYDRASIGFTNLIYRIRRDGTGNTNLTPEVATGAGGTRRSTRRSTWLRDRR